MLPANIGIIGVGLIGASLARALRRAGYKGEIRGYDLTDISAYMPQADTPEQLCEISDLIVLATPPGEFRACLASLLPQWTTDKVLTDVGSVKGVPVEQAREILGRAFPAFVPGHPIAGSEKSTAAAARDDLFDGAKVILTPLEETDSRAYAMVSELWEMTGAQIERMDYQTHDKVFAMVSHLPHLVAYSLVNCVIAHDNDMVDDHAAGGFRDYTRVANSDPAMWRDVCLLNRENLTAALSLYIAELEQLRANIEKGDGDALRSYFARAKRKPASD